MMPVQLPPAPSNYEADVRIPGNAFLATNLHPSGDDWKPHRYWKEVHEYLHDKLRGICMYCSSFIPRPINDRLNQSSIDHFVPKSIPNHAQAYEWTNFRLCRAGLNNRKDNFQDVLDPCVIGQRWFQINFTTFLLRPDDEIDPPYKQQVWDTINRFQLNTDTRYINERTHVVYRYADNKMTFANVSDRYPFIASEMSAQNFDIVHLPRLRRALASPIIRPNLIALGLVDDNDH